ncbi:hypothetical protein, conserved, partial [Trypanosoma vivax Y486]
MRRVLLSPSVLASVGCWAAVPATAMAAHWVHKSHGGSPAVPPRSHKRKRKDERRSPHGHTASWGDPALDEVSTVFHAPIDTVSAPATPLVMNKLAQSTLSKRFSHRHGTAVAHSGGITAPTSTPNAPLQQPSTSPQSSLTAVRHLIKVHAIMRNNYTALGKNVHVLDCFSRACAEALMQLGLLERHDAAPDMEAGHYIEVRILSLLEPDDGGQSTSGSSFTIAPDAPLYSEPIKIPTLEVERLLFVA